MLVMTRRMSQLLGFLILVSMIFVLLSIGSYSTEDPAWNYYTNREVASFANLGGRVGAFVADWGLQLFGTTVFVLIGCAAVGAVCLLRARVRLVLAAAVQSLLLITAASMLAHLHWLDDPYFEADLLAGGASGQWLAELLIPYLKHVGAYAVAGVVVLSVLLSCVRQSLFGGFKRFLVLTRLEKDPDELEDMYLFEDVPRPSSSLRSFRGQANHVALADEPEFGPARQLARPRSPRPAMVETDPAANSLEQEAPPQAPESSVPETSAPSFLEQRAIRPRQPAPEPTNETASEEPRLAETPPTGRSAPKVNTAGADGKQRTPAEFRPSSSIPEVRSFRAKYVLDLQRSMKKPAPEAVAELDEWEEEAPQTWEEETLQTELPAAEGSVEEPSTDLTDVSDEAEPAISEAPSWRAMRQAQPPRIVESSLDDAPLEADTQEETPPPEPLVPEGRDTDVNAERSASPAGYATRAPVLRPLAVQPVTASQQPQLPSPELLDPPVVADGGQSDEELAEEARFLEQKLREFGVEGEVVQVSPGPVITMYEFAPAAGVKVNKIANLQDDLALVMRALSVRIVAPIPGKAVVGIEVPNARRETIALRSLVDSEKFQNSSSKLNIVLGKDILGEPVITDLALIPHLLVAGATGSGKSVGLNSVICSMLFRATPAEVRMIMIDPKMLEFSIYDGIPHLLVPVVTDAKKAAVALRRVVAEMERRYQLLAAKGVRSIAQYNQKIREEQARGGHENGDYDDQIAPAEPLPYLVVMVDELSDLMMVSSREVEDSLMRIAQMARAAGIHLIVATQRPSVDVLTGVIKANFPARLSFQVTSKIDSRTILDANGAETLLGRGDMLFLAPGTSKPQRVHGAYVSEDEITRLVEAWKAIEQPSYNDSFLEPVGEHMDDEDSEYDEKYDEAIALVARTGQASISMLQRRLRVGYNRAARMIEVMEKEGIVGPADGVKPREVLVRNTYDDV